VAGGLAAHNPNRAAGTFQVLRQHIHQRLVGRALDGRGRDFDLQFVAHGAADFVFGGARLQFHGQPNAAGQRLEERGHWLLQQYCEACLFEVFIPGLDFGDSFVAHGNKR
jgi:hypothetical protein